MGILTALLPIILQYGVPFAEQVYNMFINKAAPTADDWAALKALASTSARTQMLQALAKNGIDPTSPAGQAFLALVPAP